MTFIVYMATCIPNGKIYIGKTIRGLSNRKRGHLSLCQKIKTPFARAIKKYGKDSFDWKVLYEGVDDREISAVEKAMIAQYRTMVPHGYNVSVGGEGGFNPSISLSIKCVETGEIWRSAKSCIDHFGVRAGTHLRRCINEPTRTYRGLHFVSVGKDFTPISPQAHHTKPNSPPVMCVETGETWPTQQACTLALGKTKATVHLYKCLDKPNRSWRGLHFVSKDFDKTSEPSKNYKVRPKPRRILCLETGDSWATQTACVMNLANTKSTGHLYPCLDKPNRTWKGLHFVSLAA